MTWYLPITPNMRYSGDMMMGIEITSNGLSGRVVVDGVDVSDAVQGVTVNHNAGTPPTVILRVGPGVMRVAVESGGLRAVVTDEAAALLRAAGWRGPDETANRPNAIERRVTGVAYCTTCRREEGHPHAPWCGTTDGRTVTAPKSSGGEGR